MITEEMLEKASEEAAAMLLESLPSPEECRHEFTPAFEKAMSKLVHKTAHPPRRRVLRAAACIALVLFIGLGSLFTFSTDAQEAVLRWIRRSDAGWTKQMQGSTLCYRYQGRPGGLDIDAYAPGWLPEGFTLQTTASTGSGAYYLFCDEQGRSLYFSFSSGRGTGLSIETQGYRMGTVTVNGSEGELFIPADGKGSSSLIWLDDEKDALLCISGPLPEQDLRRIAENIIKK